MEWSFDVQTEFSIELSLLWLRFHLINVDHSPFLVLTVVSRMNNDVSVFMIISATYIKNFTSLVDDVLSLVFEELEPSRVGGPDLEVSRTSSILDIE